MALRYFLAFVPPALREKMAAQGDGFAPALPGQRNRPTRSKYAQRLTAVVWLGLIWSLPVRGVSAADLAEKYVVPIQQLSSTPVIDGRLEEDAWRGAATLCDFTQFSPVEGAQPSEKTVVKLSYDQSNFYLGIRCDDSQPEKCVAKQMARDGDLRYDDSVQIILDTYHDGKNGFMFSVNPVGAKIDGVVRNEGEEVKLEWDGRWEYVTTRDDLGWTAEIVIPFSTLRFPRTEPQSWGINIQRFLPRNGELSLWKPLLRSDGLLAPYRISRFGMITGLQNLKGGWRYLLTPHVVGSTVDHTGRDPNHELDGGADLKVNLTSNLVADLTYGLDFAEAESDLQQVNLGRFPLLLPEKRAFFTEGASQFYFGDRKELFTLGQREKLIFFFSRRIGLTEDGKAKIPVLGGAKVTGKVGGVGLGLLNLTTDGITIRPPTGVNARETYTPQTNYTVLRLRKDIFSKSTVGFMALNKDASGADYNRGVGVDGDFAVGKHLTVSGFLARTFTPDRLDTEPPDTPQGEGSAGAVDVLWSSKLFRFRNMYTEIGKNFNPEMGYLTRKDIRKFHTTTILSTRPSFWRLHQFNLAYDLNYVSDRSGRLQTQTSIYEAAFVLKNGAGIALIFYDNLEVLGKAFPFRLDGRRNYNIPPGSYRFRNFFIGVATDYSKPLGATVWLDKGDYYDGTRFRFLIAPLYRPREGVQMSMIYDRQEFHFPSVRHVIVQMSGNVELTLPHQVSLRTLLQWTQDDKFGANVVFNWRFRPDADFFLVYNGTRDVGQQIVSDRSFVAKMAYSFSH